MSASLLLYLTARADGEATFEVIEKNSQAPEIIEVTVDDNEPEDVFGPLIQRAVEEAGWDFYVETTERVRSHPTPAYLVEVPEGVTRGGRGRG